MAIAYIRSLRDRIRTLEHERKAMDAEIEMLQEMLDTPKARATLVQLERFEERQREASPKEKRKPGAKATRPYGRMPVWKAAQAVLENTGRAVRRQELAEAIIAGGKKFGGDDPAASLSAHISQHQTVLGQKDGWAYLQEWPEHMRTGDTPLEATGNL